MKDSFFTFTYRTAIGVMVLSAVLLVFVQNSAPFGISASWSSQGLGTSLVFTQTSVTADIGDKVAKVTALENEVVVLEVQEILRQEGVLNYRLSDGTTEVGSVPAVEAGKTALISIPLVGVFVRMLSTSLGGMALIGLPLLMMLINYGMLVVRKVLPALSVLEKSVEKKEKKKIVHEVELEQESAMTTVLKPYRMKRKLRLQ